MAEEIPKFVQICTGWKGTVAGAVVGGLAAAALVYGYITMWPSLVLFGFGLFMVLPIRFYAFWRLVSSKLPGFDGYEEYKPDLSVEALKKEVYGND